MNEKEPTNNTVLCECGRVLATSALGGTCFCGKPISCPPTIQHEEGCNASCRIGNINCSAHKNHDCTCSREGEMQGDIETCSKHYRKNCDICFSPFEYAPHQEKPYKSHLCCFEFEEGKSPCGMKVKHRCCNCTAPVPTQEKQDWEVRFLEKWDNATGGIGVPNFMFGFIRTLRQEAKEEGRREGMSDEAINCHKHTETARLEVIAQVEEWVKNYASNQPLCNTHVHGDDLLAFVRSLKTNSK